MMLHSLLFSRAWLSCIRLACAASCRARLSLVLGLLIPALAACNFFAPPAAEQTLAADHAARGTALAFVRETATVSTNRMNGTVEAAQTAVRNADQQATRIASTLIAGGMGVVDTSRITPAAPEEAAALPGPGSAAAPIIGSGSAQGNVPLRPTDAPTPVLVANATAAPANPNAPALTGLTLTDGVGVDDCAVRTLAAFTSSAEGVYVVATAQRITPANVLTARFARESIEAVVYTWSPSFAIESACVWFYMPASEVDFSPGGWSVTLELDGVPAGTPLPFTVTDDMAVPAATAAPGA
jgi:hypothetical protein